MKKVKLAICLAVVCMMTVNFASADIIRGIDIDFVTIGNAGNAGDTRAEANPNGCGAADLPPENSASCNWGTGMIKPLKGGLLCAVKDLKKNRLSAF